MCFLTQSQARRFLSVSVSAPGSFLFDSQTLGGGRVGKAHGEVRDALEDLE